MDRIPDNERNFANSLPTHTGFEPSNLQFHEDLTDICEQLNLLQYIKSNCTDFVTFLMMVSAIVELVSLAVILLTDYPDWLIYISGVAGAVLIVGSYRLHTLDRKCRKIRDNFRTFVASNNDTRRIDSLIALMIIEGEHSFRPISGISRCHGKISQFRENLVVRQQRSHEDLNPRRLVDGVEEKVDVSIIMYDKLYYGTALMMYYLLIDAGYVDLVNKDMRVFEAGPVFRGEACAVDIRK